MTEHDDRDASSSDLVGANGRTDLGPGDDWRPYAVCAYHILIIIGSAWVSLRCRYGFCDSDSDFRNGVFAVCFGSMGGALTASRYVVYSVAHREYDAQKILWQVLTPIHSAVLAFGAGVAVRGGLITLASVQQPAEPQYTWFVIGFSFLVGLASESVVKRLIMAAEALFGERGDLDAKP